MRLGWALLLGLVGGIALAWWLSRESPEAQRGKRERAEQAAGANAEDARPVLYRWRDASGVLQVSDRPPTGYKYERVDVQPREGIEVDGSHP